MSRSLGPQLGSTPVARKWRLRNAATFCEQHFLWKFPEAGCRLLADHCDDVKAPQNPQVCKEGGRRRQGPAAMCKPSRLGLASQSYSELSCPCSSSQALCCKLPVDPRNLKNDHVVESETMDDLDAAQSSSCMTGYTCSRYSFT